jgi:uncharacterized protein YqgC (DUF456 family)
MEVIFIILGIIAIILGIIGCFVPILPGPPITYVALLLLQWGVHPVFNEDFLIVWALITIAVTALDYIIPVWGTKRFGGTKAGVNGSLIGLVFGIFVPPFGIIIGPFLGALIGELLAGQNPNKALKSALGSFLGFLGGTFIKLAVSVVMAFYFFTNLAF